MFRKIFKTLFLLMMSTAIACATTYTVKLNTERDPAPAGSPSSWYISATGSGTKDGSSQANAAAGFSTLTNHFDFTKVHPGDTIYICGEIKEALSTTITGTSGHITTVDGNCPANPGIINGSTIFTGTWTHVSDTVYSTPVSNVYGSPIDNGAILFPINYTGNDTTTVANITTHVTGGIGNNISIRGAYTDTGTGSWSYSSGSGLLYVATNDGTDPTGHTIEIPFGQAFSILAAFSGSYLDVKNLTIKNAADYGVTMRPNSIVQCVNNIFESNTVKNIGNWALFSQSSKNQIVRNNAFSYTVWHMWTGGAAGENIRYHQNVGGSIYGNTINYPASSAVDLIFGTSGVDIYSNTVTNGVGPQFSPAFYFDWADNNFLHENIVTVCKVGISTGGEFYNGVAVPSIGNLIYNNIVTLANLDALIVGGQTYTENQVGSSGNFYYNNYFSNDAFGGYLFGNTWNDHFRNNIFGSGSSTFFQLGYQKLDMDYDDFSGFNLSVIDPINGQVNQSGNLAKWFQNQGCENHLSTATPLIVGSGDFHLQGTSTLIGKGLNLSSYFTKDYYGSSRTDPWDIGPGNHI